MNRSAKVGEIAKQLRGVTYGRSDAILMTRQGFVPILRANNITDSGLNFSNLVYVPASNVSQQQFLQKGDVVIVASSGSIDVVGKSAAVTCQFVGGFGAFCKVLRPDIRVVDASYFSHYFRTPFYRAKISSMAAGANINNLKNEHLDDLEIPIPSLDDQRRIAAILDEADALRHKRKRALNLLDSLSELIFLEMFGRYNASNSSICRKPLGEIADLINGDRSSKYPSGDDLVDSGILFLNTSNIASRGLELVGANYITKEKFETLSRGKLKPNDIVITLRGSLAQTALFENAGDTGFINAQMMIIRSREKVNPKYLLQVLQLEDVRAQLKRAGSGSAVPQLTAKQISEFDIPVPEIKAQTLFANRVEKINVARQTTEVGRCHADELFASLQIRAFSGQI